jgi:hypothetical protein
MPEADTFAARFHVARFANAAYFAGPLFEESFGAAFPVPPDGGGWVQYVAFYRWGDEHLEPVGFCNYLPFGSAWLEGGLCVRRSFYGRLSGPHSDECRARGGVAQAIMEAAAADLDDCDAWFAYIGDERSLRVCTRVGYRPAGRGLVMVRWFRSLPVEEQAALVDKVAALGPF